MASLEILCIIVSEKSVGQGTAGKAERRKKKEERKKERNNEFLEKQYDCVGTQS